MRKNLNKSITRIKIQQASIERKKRKRKKKILSHKKNRDSTKLWLTESYLTRFYTNLLYFLKKQKYICHKYKENTQHIKVPNIFSLKETTVETLTFIKNILSTYFLSPRKITYIDFSNCKKICMSGFTLFDIIIKEIQETKDNFNKYSHKQIRKQIAIIKSGRPEVDKYLLAFNYISELENAKEGDEYLPLGLKSGSKKSSYRENIKAKTCSNIIEFVNETLRKYDTELNETGKNSMDGMISEILGNVEDHSIKKTWYVNGISYKDIKDDIIELNLSILNFGISIYEGFEENKELNIDTYSEMESLYHKHERLFTKNNSFTKESLFTLYALQEGISRLKYERSSRGNGTMNFINAFIDLGEYGNKDPKFTPELNIISGYTILCCNNYYKPFPQDGLKILSLNQEKDLSLLPDKKNLYSSKENFPGTFLDVKIYLDKTRLEEAIKNQQNGKN